MDFFPDLGEPGLIDELFYLGPLLLQVILGIFFLWLLSRVMKESGVWTRIAATVGLLIATNILLLIAFGVVFKISNPTL